MQLSIQICSSSCNAQRALPRPCTEGDVTGCWGGSLDARGFRASPLNNFLCNSSDLLLWHRLFLIISGGISFSFCHWEGPLALLSLSCSVYACCLFWPSCFLFLFASVYLSTSVSFCHFGSVILQSANPTCRLSTPNVGGGCWMFCFRWLCWPEMGIKTKWDWQLRIFRAFSHFIHKSDLMCLPLKIRLREVLHALCRVWCVANEVKSPHWTQQLWRHWSPQRQRDNLIRASQEFSPMRCKLILLREF